MRLCVFCGSQSGRSTRYAAAAAGFGTAMARRGLGLVYGGGNVGLMKVVADAVLEAGGEAIGVIPGPLVERELAHPGLSELIVVPSMHLRKQRMHDLAGGFVALPGGYGTLDELFEALTWAQLGVHQKPCALLEVEGFFAPLLQLIRHQVAEGFVRPAHAALLLVAEEPERLLDALLAYQAPPTKKWIDPSET